MIWAALTLIAGMIGVSVLAWYFTRRLESSRRAGTELGFTRRAAWIPIVVGAVIIAEGLAAFVITDDWAVLVPTVCVGLLTGALGVRAMRLARRGSDGTRQASSSRPTGPA